MKTPYQEPSAEVIRVTVEQAILDGTAHSATLDSWDEEDID